MKTLLTPSLIAIACFSAMTAAAEVAVSVQNSSATQLQFNQSTSNTSINGSQQASADTDISAMQNHSGAEARINTEADAEGSSTDAAPAQPDTAANESVLTASNMADSTAVLTGMMSSSTTLTENLLTSGKHSSTALTGAAATSLKVLNNSTGQITDQSKPAPNLESDAVVTTATRASQQVNADLASHTGQQLQQQVIGNTSQLVQQSTTAAVAQTVSQTVSAEVNNTVRNTIKLSTGL